ncbi:thioesterase family protein [Natronomonas sp. LN261]|uniref:thioesterase family protein n=1 Tax=Natronomonas sp. LN261 TaxID=2750669 RepID=UPI0015EEBBDC|nr:hotdog domain-containing protein [Natronomonas sp. LN261]
MEEELPEPGLTAERTVRVEPRHATVLFGEQDEPPGLPAATDAADGEAVSVLGTPQLLAEVEFLGRESLRGHLPAGTGVVGIDAEVTHRRAVPVGQSVRVRTEIADVTDRTITVEGELSRADSGAPVGTVRNRMRVVRREAFSERVRTQE